jgi:hypothetical protein
MSFPESLEAGIQVARRKWLLPGVVMLLAGIALALLLVKVHLALLLPTPLPLLLLVAGAWLVLRGHPSASELAALRGGTPSLWLPSQSHGVVVAAGELLLAGGLLAPLDQHAAKRVDSISFDEQGHAMTVDVVAALDGEREQRSRAVVKLDASVTAQQAHDFARTVLERSSR